MTCRLKSAVCLMTLTLHAWPAIAQESKPYKGMRLTEALQAMQALGLRVVFSSAVVPPDLFVATEPRPTASPRQQLEELLAAHHLEVREGPGQTLQVVRARRTVKRSPPAAVEEKTERRGMDVGTPDVRRYIEYVSVSDSVPERRDRGVASEMSLGGGDFTRLHGSLSEDPLRVVQSFPGVTAVNDFRSDFAVRGSPFRHASFVIDGVSTHWLQHTVHGRGATGSLAMLSGLVVERATLRTGAFPRRYSDRLGPELDVTIREGSRNDFALRGAIGGSHAVLVAEGPLGGDGAGRSARGSWLVTARQSYLEWPPERYARTAFGFSDAVAKVVFDVRPTQRLGLTMAGGLAAVDDEDNLAPDALAIGTNRAALVNLSWQSTFGQAFVVRQQASLVTHRFRNAEQSGRERDGGVNGSIAYRADISRPMVGGLLEAGAQIEQTTTTMIPSLQQQTLVGGSGWVRSGFAHFVWAPARSLTVSPGVRITSSTLARDPAVSRWLLGEWSFRPRWSFIGSMGVSRQIPDLALTLGELGSPSLRTERASDVELGIEQRMTSAVRWQATVFNRREADVLRPPETHSRLVGDVLVVPGMQRYSNALQGTSRGFEVLVSRREPLGLSGWVSYSYGRTRQTDIARAETYWADFDQRHTLNLFGVYRLSSTTSVGATFRAGSNFPVPGYLASRAGRLVAADTRNRVRLPAYRRLDVRADRQFQSFGRRLTLFVEALNALNRTNVGAGRGRVDPVTGAANGFTEPLLRRRVSAGIIIEF